MCYRCFRFVGVVPNGLPHTFPHLRSAGQAVLFHFTDEQTEAQWCFAQGQVTKEYGLLSHDEHNLWFRGSTGSSKDTTRKPLFFFYHHVPTHSLRCPCPVAGRHLGWGAPPLPVLNRCAAVLFGMYAYGIPSVLCFRAFTVALRQRTECI